MRGGVWMLAAALAVLASIGRAEPTPADLLARAAAARAAAEADLAATRQRHLAERRKLAAELQAAYEALAAARAEATATTESLDRLTDEAAGLDRDAAVAERRTRAMIEQAAAAARTQAVLDGPVEQIEPGLRAGIRQRIEAIEHDLTARVERAAIIGRDGRKQTVPVLRFGGFASYACGRDRTTQGLLASAPDGAARVVGPYLDPAGVEALTAAAGGALTHVPIDADGSLRDRQAAEPKTWRTWLEAGGPFVYPIAVVGALGVFLVLERVSFLVRAKIRPALMTAAVSALERGEADLARQTLAKSRTPTARVLLAGIDTAGEADEQREAAVESALLAEAPRLERSLSLLAALAGVAPLLGLLGTVSGMIATFDVISSAGTGNPRLLSGGISEALITTQLGLMVAIPLLLAHAGLRRWVERREAMLEHSAVRILGIRPAAPKEEAP